MALLECLSGIFERMEKKIIKSKDLTPGKVVNFLGVSLLTHDVRVIEHSQRCPQFHTLS